MESMSLKTDSVTRFDLDELQEENYSIEIQNRYAVLSSEFQEKSSDDKWELVKGTILQVAEETLRRK